MDADLVLEGGGVKGIGLVGAYAALTDKGYTFHRIAGTSAGAIVGALIACGMPPRELEQIMREVKYKRFQDEGFLDHLGLPGKAISLLFKKGIYEGKYLHDVARRSAQEVRQAHVRRPAPGRCRVVAAAGAPIPLGRDDLRRHPGRAGAPARGTIRDTV